MNDLIRFYKNEIPCSSGHTIDEIIGWDDLKLEGIHNYIQWVFPIEEPSAFNIHCPVLMPEDVFEFASDPEIKNRFYLILHKMFKFYGFKPENKGMGFGLDFESRKHKLFSYKDHNQLRMTRILRCLCLLGFEELAHMFYNDCLIKGLERTGNNVNKETEEYWLEAIQTKPLKD